MFTIQMFPSAGHVFALVSVPFFVGYNQNKNKNNEAFAKNFDNSIIRGAALAKLGAISAVAPGNSSLWL